MDTDLLPPFCLQESGIDVFERPKIHKSDPTVDDHSIKIPEVNLCIPLKIHVIFSYFPTSASPSELLQYSDNVCLLTPETWNPHDESYTLNLDNMLDWEGYVIPPSQ